MLGGASVLGKPLTVWTRGMLEAPFPSAPCGVGLRSDFREVQVSNPQMLIPFTPSWKRFPGDNTKPQLLPMTRISPPASLTVSLM